MRKPISGLIVAAVVVMEFAIGIPEPAEAKSCGATLNTCAVRCKKDNPTDASCVSDHCQPKYAQCLTTGCWQEGNRYGGGTTCNMDRK